MTIFDSFQSADDARQIIMFDIPLDLGTTCQDGQHKYQSTTTMLHSVGTRNDKGTANRFRTRSVMNDEYAAPFVVVERMSQSTLGCPVILNYSTI